jgi:hypothetical protein
VSEWGRPESQGERIEIELTPVEPRHERPSVAGATPVDRSPHEGGTDPGEPAAHGDGIDDHVPRRTVIVTALAVGVAALATGWVVGRSDESTSGEQTSPATTVTATATTEHFDTIAPPVTTARPRRSTTTTTTLAAGTPVDILLPPELRALPYELALASYDGKLVRLDLSAATTRTYRTARDQEIAFAFSPSGSDLVTFNPWDARSLRVVALDGSETRLPFDGNASSVSQQLVVDGVGSVWAVTNDDLATIVFSTEPVGEVVQLPLGSVERSGVVGDPAGGLLTTTSGDIFEIDPSGSRRLTTGEVVAIGAAVAIVHECDEALNCDYITIDRTTGERTFLPLREMLADATTPEQRLAPDARTIVEHLGLWSNQRLIAGNTAAIVVTTVTEGSIYTSRVAVIDIAAQRVVGTIPDAYGASALSDDGSWVFAMSEGTTLVAFEVATGNSFQFRPDSIPGPGAYSIKVRTK